MKRILIFSLLLSFIFCGVKPVRATEVYFDDSSPNLIVLGHASYEFGFRKANGSIQYIEDKSTGKIISPGSRYECLWGGVFLVNNAEQFTGRCNYNSAWNEHFSYSYYQTLSRLTFSYTAGPQASRRIDAIVLIQANSNNSLGMHLQITNSSVDMMERALFPCDLVFLKGEIQEALIPGMPGLVLEFAFF
jgi:hypothetical protein